MRARAPGGREMLFCARARARGPLLPVMAPGGPPGSRARARAPFFIKRRTIFLFFIDFARKIRSCKKYLASKRKSLRRALKFENLIKHNRAPELLGGYVQKEKDEKWPRKKKSKITKIAMMARPYDARTLASARSSSKTPYPEFQALSPP